MGVSEIIASVDREIALLKQVRALLSGGAVTVSKKKAGRPGQKAAVVNAAAPKPAKKAGRKKKRTLSPEGRKRIAEAVKRRWEKHRKAAAASK